MRTSRTVAASLLLLTLAACGDDGETTTGAPDTDAPGAVDRTPGGADGGLFIEVAYAGGFVMQGFDFRNPPAAVVYDDGTVVAPGAVPAIFPGPAVLPMFTGEVDEAVLDDLLEAVADTGILEGTPDYGDMSEIGVADAPSTRVTVVVDGEAHVVEAYALAEATPGMLDEEQQAARESLLALVTAVQDAATSAATEPLDPERYRVLALSPVDPADVELGTAVDELAWPDGLPEPVENECVAITGDGVAAFEEALATANELTQWIVGDRTFTLSVRGVLPHEPDCPGT